MTERKHWKDVAQCLSIAGQNVRKALEHMGREDDLTGYGFVPKTMFNISAQLSSNAEGLHFLNGQDADREHKAWEMENEDLVERIKRSEEALR